MCRAKIGGVTIFVLTGALCSDVTWAVSVLLQDVRMGRAISVRSTLNLLPLQKTATNRSPFQLCLNRHHTKVTRVRTERIGGILFRQRSSNQSPTAGRHPSVRTEVLERVGTPSREPPEALSRRQATRKARTKAKGPVSLAVDEQKLPSATSKPEESVHQNGAESEDLECGLSKASYC